MALALTQPPTETSTWKFSVGVRAAGALGCQPYQLHVLIVFKSGNLNLLEPSRPVTGLDRDCFTICFGICCYILFKVCVETHITTYNLRFSAS